MLAQDMNAFESSLRAAELRLAGWLGPSELAGVLRSAYDPSGWDAVAGTEVRRNLSTAGPIAVEEHWDHLRHDTGFSAVLWISEWPRIDVPPHFLHALVFAPGVRKTISLTATPLSTAAALRDIRKAKVEYATDSAQKARIGFIEDLADVQELADVNERERALISGHADMKFTGLIAVTAPTKDELDAAVSQVQRAATQALLRDPTPRWTTGSSFRDRGPAPRTKGPLKCPADTASTRRRSSPRPVIRRRERRIQSRKAREMEKQARRRARTRSQASRRGRDRTSPEIMRPER